MAAVATLYVCTTCRRAEADAADAALPDAAVAERPRAGAQMLAAIAALDLPDGVQIKGVECLSACSNACSVALSAPGKWTYVYGNMDPALHGPAILDGAARYAASDTGLVPWRERPEIFRKQSLARIPPQE